MTILRNPDETHILTHGDGSILRVPTLVFNYGQLLIKVLDASSGRPKIGEIDLSTFTDYGAILQDPIRVSFPEEVGYVAFAISVSTPQRLSWAETGSPLNFGPIGGKFDDEPPNLWPRGETKLFGDNLMLVYWTSEVTKFRATQLIQLRAF
jgi:hypothetical protein